jgi:hypothetical protein
MALVTVHQWRDVDQGLRELRRVTRGPIVLLAFDGDELDRLQEGRTSAQRVQDGYPHYHELSTSIS